MCVLVIAEPQNVVQDLKDKIVNRYRVRMVLDNMPITTFDLTTVRNPFSSLVLLSYNCRICQVLHVLVHV